LFAVEVVIGQPQRFILQQQADQLLQQIVQRQQIPLSFWGLVELAKQYDDVRTYIEARAVSLKERRNEVECYLGILSDLSQNDPIRSAWECEDQADFAVLYLYGQPSASRSELLERYSARFSIAANDPVIRAYLDRAVNPSAPIGDITKPRAFRAADIHLIPPGYTYEDEHAASYLALLTVWKSELPVTRRNLAFADIYAIFHIIDSYHQAYHYAGIYEYLPMLSGNSTFPDLDIKLRTYRRVAFSSYHLGYYLPALEFYRVALRPLVDRMASANDTYMEARLRVETDYGSIQYRLGDLEGARETYANIYPDRSYFQDLRSRSILLNNLAVSYLNTGRMTDYIELQLQALEDARSTDYTFMELQILKNLYVYHWRRGDWDNAILYLNSAYEVALKMNDSNELGNILSLFASYHREYRKDYQRAYTFNVQSIDLLREYGARNTLLLAQFELALTLESLRRFDDAIELYESLEQEADIREDLISKLVTRIQRIDLLQRLGRHDETESALMSIQQYDLSTILDFEKFVESVNVIATDHIHRQDHDGARLWLEPMMNEIFQRLGSSADDQTGFIRFKPEFTETIRLLTQTYLTQHNQRAAAELLDKVKAVNQASFINSDLIRATVLSESDRISDVRLAQTIEEVRAGLMRASPDEKLELNNRLIRLQQERAQLKSGRIPTVSTIKVDLQHIQRQLAPGDLAVSITMLDSLIFRTAVTSTTIRVDEIRNSTQHIESWSRTEAETIEGDINLNDLHSIYTILFDDLFSEQIPSKLFFLPDGPLHRIPIEILPMNRPENSTSFGSVNYLIESTPVTYATSLNELTSHQRKRNTHTHDYIGIGISRLVSFPALSPLPYAELEIRRIVSTMTRFARTLMLLGNDATEHRIKTTATDTRVLHVASHSEVNMIDPLFSVIYVESDEKTDGALYAYELFGMNLNIDLIMLSSCESASGTYIQGSGMVGLGRALQFAGARSLIMNTWSIRDQTASDISTWFYENLNEGMSKNEALRMAKVRYITTRNSDPYIWGSFILIGDDEPLVKKISIRGFFFGGILMLILGGVLFWLVRQRRS
jgi:CHAT domain-containing protein